MTAPRSTSSDDDTSRKIELSATQVTATALAAVTSAVLGSQLGAAGTLIGAAVASVIYTVASAVYRVYLERSRERVRSLAARRTRPFPALREETRTERVDPATANPPAADERLTDGADREPQDGARSGRFATLRWGAMVGAALGGFVLAMMVITGFEQVSGQPLGGNGEGTTIGRAVTDPPGPAVPPAPPSSSVPASEAPTGTTGPSSTATETTTPDREFGVEQRPSETSGTPTPSEVTPPPPLIPTRLPGPGG